MNETAKLRAPRNRTLTLSFAERARLAAGLLRLPLAAGERALDRIVWGDAFATMQQLPREFADLIVLDPPYNLTKQFGDEVFRQRSLDDYETWIASWLPAMVLAAKPTASFYVCGDWRSSTALHRVLARHVIVRNRITWEREKGRGAAANWKNASEDIWFCTRSADYVFNVDAVKLKRRVVAPYREDGEPKDWAETADGAFRLTHPSNLMTDLTVPFWSMPENTDHPTQKPEKLLAKLILASTRAGDVVLDPFLGSGTTAVVARKLGRRFVGIEADETYCCLAARRIEMAENDRTIQGYVDGVFWERNTLASQPKSRPLTSAQEDQRALELALDPSGGCPSEP